MAEPLTDADVDATQRIPTAADVVAAAKRVDGLVHRTPLLRSSLLDEAVQARVLVKAEHLQRTGSFKIRGALNRLLQLSDDERARGVVAYSSGNHAQAVALAARIVGVSATIVMPSDAPAVKLDATSAYGAAIVTYDRATEDRAAIAGSIAAERGATVVPPFDDADVIAGQGTVGVEIAEDCPDVATVVVPVGGGGLCAGTALALKSRNPAIRIIGVEPETADDARQSLAAGAIIRIPQPTTIADGVATQSLGSLTFPILRDLVDGIVTVSEAEIAAALRFVVLRMKQVLEPTGALTIAALLNGRVPGVAGDPGPVVAIGCGGNVDVATLGRLCATLPERTDPLNRPAESTC